MRSESRVTPRPKLRKLSRAGRRSFGSSAWLRRDAPDARRHLGLAGRSRVADWAAELNLLNLRKPLKSHLRFIYRKRLTSPLLGSWSIYVSHVYLPGGGGESGEHGCQPVVTGRLPATLRVSGFARLFRRSVLIPAGLVACLGCFARADDIRESRISSSAGACATLVSARAGRQASRAPLTFG